MLRQRLAQTTPAAQEVAGLAAATGADFTLDLLTEASDLDAGTVVGAVDELWRRRIVRELGDGYEFSHDLLRDAAYDLVSPPRRWLLHRRLAAALELLHGDDTGPVAAQLAAHHAHGGQPARAVTYYQQAAEIAARPVRARRGDPAVPRGAGAARGLPAGPAGTARSWPFWSAMAAPLNARDGYASPELQRPARALDHAGRVAGPHRLADHRPGHDVDLAVRPRPDRRQLRAPPTGRWPSPSPARS